MKDTIEELTKDAVFDDAQKQASNCGLDISRLEVLLEKIENNLIQRSLSDKYKAMFYLAATGRYSAEDLAEMFDHSSKNLNADFNKNLGGYLKLYLGLDDDERVGITSLRRILFKKGYFVDINDDNLVNILSKRYSQNARREAASTGVVLPSEE
jgi:hypothetical protein